MIGSRTRSMCITPRCIRPLHTLLLEFVYGFKSEVPSALRETPIVQYNYDSYLTEIKERLQSAHEIAKQKLIISKEKSKKYYDKCSEKCEIQVGQKILLFDETVRRGRSKKLSPQYIGQY